MLVYYLMLGNEVLGCEMTTYDAYDHAYYLSSKFEDSISIVMVCGDHEELFDVVTDIDLI